MGILQWGHQISPKVRLHDFSCTTQTQETTTAQLRYTMTLGNLHSSTPQSSHTNVDLVGNSVFLARISRFPPPSVLLSIIVPPSPATPLAIKNSLS